MNNINPLPVQHFAVYHSREVSCVCGELVVLTSETIKLESLIVNYGYCDKCKPKK